MKHTLLPHLIRLGMTLAIIIAVNLLILVPFALYQGNALAVISGFYLGPLSSIRHLGNIAEFATPVILTGLATILVFRVGLFNLGMEGAVFLGGLGATAAAIFLPLPGWCASVLATLAGALLGSIATIVPGYLRVRYDASEMVTSLVFNYALLFAGIFVLNHFLRDPAAGTLMSYRIPAEARLERLLDGTRLNSGIIIAVLMCLAMGLWMYTTRAGLNLRIIGKNPGFARHLGLPVGHVMMHAQIAAGLIAGMAGAIEVLGLYPRFSWTTLPGLGWTGIIVAILARENPFLIIPAALFMGYLQVGGDYLARNMGMPTEVVGLITSVIMLAVTATAIFQHPRILQALRHFSQKEAIQ